MLDLSRLNINVSSSGSSGRVRGGGEKHEIYVAAFGGHLFYDLFSQGRGSHGPLGPPPRIRYWLVRQVILKDSKHLPKSTALCLSLHSDAGEVRHSLCLASGRNSVLMGIPNIMQATLV